MTMTSPAPTHPETESLSPDDGVQVIRTEAALIDYTGAGLFQITGDRSADFVSFVTTRSVDFLLEGQSQQALLLTPQGHVISDVVIHGTGNGYIVQVWPDQAELAASALTGALEDAHRWSGVTLEDLSATHTILGVEGPTSYRIADRYLDFPVSSLAYQASVVVAWEGAEVVITRAGVTGEFGYLFRVETGAAPRLRADLLGAGAVAVPRESVDIARMEMRFVAIEHEAGTRERTPFELGLAWMVDLSGDFVGKDALLAADDPDRRPVCWVLEGDADSPTADADVTIDDTTIGSVVHQVHSPQLGTMIGTALIDKDFAASGIEIGVGGHAARTVSAPFLIATSFNTPME